MNRGIKHANELLAWCPAHEAKPFAKDSDTALTRLTVDLPTHPLPEARTITVASDTLVGNVHDGALALGEQQANLFIRGDKLVSIIETRIDHRRGRASYAQRLAIGDDFALLMNLSAAAKWQRYDGRSEKMKFIDCPEARKRLSGARSIGIRSEHLVASFTRPRYAKTAQYGSARL